MEYKLNRIKISPLVKKSLSEKRVNKLIKDARLLMKESNNKKEINTISVRRYEELLSYCENKYLYLLVGKRGKKKYAMIFFKNDVLNKFPLLDLIEDFENANNYNIN